MVLDFPPVRLQLLGEFELRGPPSSDVLHVSMPAQRLLALLALRGRPMDRRQVAETLWCDLDNGAARLRSALWRLPSPSGLRLAESVGSRLRLSDRVEVDVRLSADEHRWAELGIDQLAEDVLTGWADDWMVAERERFRQLRLHRLEQLSERAEREGQFSTALHAALSAVAADPLRESAHRRVMRIHLAEANPSEALRQFDLIRRLLRDDLGLAPSHATRSVVSHLLGRPLDNAC